MVVGVGVDLIEAERITEALGRHPERMKARLFTDGEQAYCEGRHTPALHYAARFAAKEAFSKAVGTGFTGNLKWREIEIENLPGGEPVLRLHGVAAELAARRGADRCHVSLSHSRGMAVAVVLLEGPGPAAP
ncbi:MAG: holo-ACP synthase [Candidatus Sumerlaeia bacterium]|nr:holo-ACP synthase [Candidatus Sumerlaeia bacterium]